MTNKGGLRLLFDWLCVGFNISRIIVIVNTFITIFSDILEHEYDFF